MNELGAVLEARGLSKRFTSPGIVDVVRNVTFSLKKGTLATLMGPSGSGKSTLLALLGGLLAPTTGKVSVKGAEISGLTPYELSRRRNVEIGFVFQFHHLLPELTALENVMLPALIASREGWIPATVEEAEREAGNNLEAVGLGARTGHFPTQLSGGEAQRTAIARALMNRPAVILADEPTGNLDRETAAGIMDLFLKLNRDSGQTFLVATHNPDMVKRSSICFNLVAGELKA